MESLIIIANSNNQIGAGHAMRCLAIAEEWISRGRSVFLFYQQSLDWVLQRYLKIGANIQKLEINQSISNFFESVKRSNSSLILIDSYDISDEIVDYH